MKIQKHRLILSLCFAVVASLSFGQAAGPTGGQLKNHAGQNGGRGLKGGQQLFFKSINLTKEQMVKLRDIQKAAGADLKAFRTAHEGDLPAIRQHAKDVRQQTETSMLAVFTPEQAGKYQQWKAGQRQLAIFGSDRAALTKMNLKPEQMTAVMELKGKELEAAQKVLIENLDNPSMLQQAVAASFARYQADLHTILTSDQLTEYQALARRGRKGKKAF